MEIDGAGEVPVHQLVSSPIRNALGRGERIGLRLAISKFGRRLGNALERWSGRHHDEVRWEIEDGPFFHNGMAALELRGAEATAVFERAMPDDDGGRLDVVARRRLAP